MTRNLLRFSLVLFTGIFTSCGHKTDLTGLKEISFTNDIQPVISANCAQSGCHSNNSGGGRELFSLTNYNDVINNAEVRPGNAKGSKLYEVISNQLFVEIMPPSPNPPLTDDQIKLIYLWIEQGAKNN